MAEGDTSPNKQAGTKIIITFLWVLSLVFVGMLSFSYGKDSLKSQIKPDDKVLSAQSNQLTAQDTPAENTTPVTNSTLVNSTAPISPAADAKVCAKNGAAQKWEYLTPYVIKANDTLESIATNELKDNTRVNEILKLNGVGPLVIGSTLYLPPPSITKSSGNIQKVYGKLVEINDTSWHISFTTDASGQGILIPSFLFASVPNKDTFHIGDCISVLLDDGYKIYTLAGQN